MIDEFKLRRDAERELRAQALLEDELLKETVAAMESQYIDAMLQTDPKDDVARRNYHLVINYGRKFRESLAQVIRDGRIARAQLNEIEQRSKLEQIRRSLRVV